MFPSNNVRAILWATLGCFLIASMWALAKALGTRFDSQQIAFFRALSGLLLVLPFVAIQGFKTIRTNRLGLHAARGVAGAIGMMCGFYAVTRLPLSDATALSFTQPLFLVLLAAVFLKEHVGLRRLALVACGFLGVLIMVRPGFEEVGLVTLIALTGALAAACVKLFVKQLAVTEAPLTILFYLALVMTVVTAGPALLHWQNPTPAEHAALMATGALATLAQLCIIRAYKSGEASAVAPAEYTRLLFAAFFGVLLFGEVLDPLFLLGAAIIILSTLYVEHDKGGAASTDKSVAGATRRRQAFGPRVAACSVLMLCCLLGFSVELDELGGSIDPLLPALFQSVARDTSATAQSRPTVTAEVYPGVRPVADRNAPSGADMTVTGDYPLASPLGHDAPALAELTSATQTINEEEKTVVFLVRLLEPAKKLTFLAYTTIEASAKEGEDYQRSRGVIALKPGQTAATIRLSVLDDDVAEGEERFELWLTAAPNVARLRRKKAVITIRASDQGRDRFQSGMVGDR